MSKEKYDGSSLILNPWPDWIAEPDGGWARHWTIGFVNSVPHDRLLSAELGGPNLTVHLTQRASPNEIRLVTVTRGNAWSDEIFFFEFHALFERLEKLFGRIQTIQGQARDLWRPFR